MRDDYYNHMLTSLISDLKNKMMPWNEPKTMTQYMTMDPKAWDKLVVLVEGIYSYDNGTNPDKLQNYYNNELYPVLTTGTIFKKGFSKIYAIKIDSFDFRMLLSGCESLIF